jgi:hypothetical protein
MIGLNHYNHLLVKKKKKTNPNWEKNAHNRENITKAGTDICDTIVEVINGSIMKRNRINGTIPIKDLIY